MSEQKNLQTIDSTANLFLKTFSKSLEGYALCKYDQNAFLKSAMLAIVNNAVLSECLRSENGKKSLFNAMRYAASTGLSLNPMEGKAALIGYKSKGEMVISYQIMKNGMVETALKSGKVEILQADYVKENDKFKLKKTASGDDYDFTPALKDRGEIVGFYASLKLKDGPTHVKWMTKEEIEDHRDRYSSMFKFNKENSPWEKSFSGMGIKTVIKALLRSVTISDELTQIVNSDGFIDADFTVTPGPGISADSLADKMKENKKNEKKSGDLL